MLDRNNRFWKGVVIFFSAITLLLSINQIFNLKLFGFIPMLNEYLYYLLAFNLSLVFIIYPAVKKDDSNQIKWYDLILFFLAIAINIYLAFQSEEMIKKAWEQYAPMLPTILSVIQWGIVIEAVRRTNGTVLATFCLIFSFYPLFASKMPFFLAGQSYSFLATAKMHILGVNSILGIPLQVVGTLLIGFMLFGVVLQYSGGGKFFMDFSTSTFGHVRGGPAKVAVIASALFGSLSGSAISNVITSGSVTIPAMKETGYKDYYAAAIEACASTGGNIMPPVMGAAAFVMASFLNVNYHVIVIAAIIPALLYYLGLFFQVDSYAIKHGLKGMPKESLPKLSQVFKDGWFYVLGFIVMFYFIFAVRMESKAPFYASLSLLLIAMLKKETRLDLNKFAGLFVEFGKLMSSIISILTAVGLIVGGLMITGVALSFSRELVHAVSGTFPLLVVGAITSFILGFGLTSTAVYILLSIVLAPALLRMGIEPLSSHFFILYWGILSFITPPVAMASYAAAGIAKSDPTKTGLVGMRLGFVSYIIPFAFVYNPALLAQGPLTQVLWFFTMAVIGIFLIANSFEGYMTHIGRLNLFLRISFSAAGVSLLFPFLIVNLIGLGIAAVLVIIGYRTRKPSVELP
jgi:TRAP transporter 4TM/12TM fusion protein